MEVTICDLKLGRQKISPYAFTEQGVAMLSSVLNSERAIKVNIAIMSVFVKMREYLQSNEKLARKLKETLARRSAAKEGGKNSQNSRNKLPSSLKLYKN